MLEKQRRTNIIKDSQYTFPVHGKILKFTVNAKRLPARAKVKILTNEGEVVLNEIITSNVTTIHPINVIRRNVVVETEPQSIVVEVNGQQYETITEAEAKVVSEVVYSDYYYSLGSVLVTVSGLKEGESVDELVIISQKDQPHE